MRYIFSKILPHWPAFAITMVFLCIEAFADLLLPSVMSLVVDRGIAQGDTALIAHYALLMLLIAFTGAAGAVMRNFLSARYSELIGKEIREEVYSKIETFSFSSFDHLPPGDLITRLTNDVTQIQNFVFSLMRILVKAPLVSIGSFALIIYNSPRYAPVVFLVIVAAVTFVTLNAVLSFPRFAKAQGAIDRVNGKVREFLNAIRIVKAFSAEEKETESFSSISKELEEKNVSALRVSAVFMSLVNFAVNFGIVLILLVSNLKPSEGVGSLMASVNYMTQLLVSLSLCANIINRSVRASASSARVTEILNEPVTQVEKEGARTEPGEGSVELKSVSFAYHEGANDTLKGVSFSLPPGTSLAVIGATGSGKSTLASLLMRFYDTDRGSVLLDGTDVQDWTMKALREEITIVTQKPVLFSGSVRENMRLAKEDASDEEIIHALRLAEALFVLTLPDGLDTDLSERGVNLSGGQKQRLSIARSLLRGAKVLILDDSTSALDSLTEHRLLSNLFALDITLIVITQRVSTAAMCDRILVLEEGEVKGDGSAEDLYRDSEVYREIHNSQIGA